MKPHIFECFVIYIYKNKEQRVDFVQTFYIYIFFLFFIFFSFLFRLRFPKKHTNHGCYDCYRPCTTLLLTTLQFDVLQSGSHFRPRFVRFSHRWQCRVVGTLQQHRPPDGGDGNQLHFGAGGFVHRRLQNRSHQNVHPGGKWSRQQWGDFPIHLLRGDLLYSQHFVDGGVWFDESHCRFH